MALDFQIESVGKHPLQRPQKAGKLPLRQPHRRPAAHTGAT